MLSYTKFPVMLHISIHIQNSQSAFANDSQVIITLSTKNIYTSLPTKIKHDKKLEN